MNFAESRLTTFVRRGNADPAEMVGRPDMLPVNVITDGDNNYAGIEVPARHREGRAAVDDKFTRELAEIRGEYPAFPEE